MKKSRAVISLLLVAVVTGLMAYTVLIGFGKGHRGSYHNIKKGLDLAGGASITYQAVGEEPPTQEDLNDTKYKLQRRVDQYSTEAQVYTEGTDRLNIEIPGISTVSISRSRVFPASLRRTRFWRISDVPALCILSARQMMKAIRIISLA